MARFTGKTLKIARLLTGIWPIQAVAGRRMRKSYGVDTWQDLPADAKDGFETSDHPIPGRAPREWGDGGLDVPDGRDGVGEAWREAYREGRVTPVQAVEAIRARIEEGRFGAARHSPFVRHDWERARKQAEASAERWADGEPLSPIDGIPVPIKDHHAQAGVPTSSGTTYFADWQGPEEADSEVVGRLAEAGAVLIGKSITTEWGLQPTGFSPHVPMPRNPYEGEHAAGGSSTGTGVAVALGMAPVGLGSDGGGSIRIPSAVNGLFGLKPTYQRLSRDGDHWGRSTLGHSGPIGRSTEDLVDFLSVTGGEPHAEDPATVPPDDIDGAGPTGPEAWRRALGRGIEGATIGVWSWAMKRVDDQVGGPVEEALAVLEDEGAEVRSIDIEFGAQHQAIGTMTFGAEFLGLLADTIDRFPDQTGDDVRMIYNVFESIELEEYMESRRMRAVLRESLAEAISNVDLIAMPTTGMPAPRYPHDQTGKAVYDEEAISRLCQFAFLTNLTGLPAGSVPCGRIGELPVGLQFVGDAWDEASVLAAMAHCERAGIADIPEPPCFERVVNEA
jgi:aspartyl-tRNA(Asn)/glutamyl-tRNA(Gln) amidotransferase subunit A